MPDVMMVLPVDRNLPRQLKTAHVLIGVCENDSIARSEIAILAQPIRAQKEALGASMELRFTATRGRSLFPSALETHVVREGHFNIERLDFEFKLVARRGQFDMDGSAFR